MTVSQIEQLSLPLNLSPSLVGVRLNELFLGLGPIALSEVTLRRRTSEIFQDLLVTVSFRQPGGNDYFAVVFIGDTAAGGLSADDKVANYFATMSLARGHTIIDLTPELKRNLYQDSLVVILATEPESECLPNTNRPRIVEADALIGPSATGTASLRSSDGTFTNITIDVVNTSPNNWAAGTPGIAIYDILTCTWQGYPSCC